MKRIVDGLLIILSRKDSRLVCILATTAFFLLLLVIQNGSTALQVFSFDVISLEKRFYLAFAILFNMADTFSISALIVSILGSLLGGINISLAYTYIKMRGEILIRSGLYSGFGLVAAFIGIGCAACGTALLSVLVSFFGLSTMLHLLPYQGQEIGYIGIIFLCIATYSLATRVSEPATC